MFNSQNIFSMPYKQILLVFLWLSFGCSVLKQDTNQLNEAESTRIRNLEPENGRALVYFVREGAYVGGGALTAIDPGIGILLVQGNKSVCAKMLSPGKYNIRIHQIGGIIQDSLPSKYVTTATDTKISYTDINPKGYKKLYHNYPILISAVGRNSYTESTVELEANKTYYFKYKYALGKDVMNSMRMVALNASEAKPLIANSKCSNAMLSMGCNQLGQRYFNKYEDIFHDCQFKPLSGFILEEYPRLNLSK